MLNRQLIFFITHLFRLIHRIGTAYMYNVFPSVSVFIGACSDRTATAGFGEGFLDGEPVINCHVHK